MNGALSIPGYRDTWAEIDLRAIAWNAERIRRRIGPDTVFMAVVKADGYGHGAIQVARTALRSGADRLGVATADEALQLRAAGIDAPILILGCTPPRSMKAAIGSGIALTVFTPAELSAADAAAVQLGATASVHLKLDTGMGRLGAGTLNEAAAVGDLIRRSGRIRLEGAFTHFAAADGPDESFTELQFRRFMDLVSGLEAGGLRVPIKHCCNSAAALRYPQMRLDLVRVGLALYGLLPAGVPDADDPGLRSAMSLRTRIVSLKSAAEGSTVSYGRTYAMPRDGRIAVLPIGYADGYSRRLSNRGEVLAGGRRARVAGAVCMDQTMIDATDCPGLRVGDEVILFGGPGDSAVSADEIAAWTDMISYEVVCGIGKRVPRLYVGED